MCMKIWLPKDTRTLNEELQGALDRRPQRQVDRARDVVGRPVRGREPVPPLELLEALDELDEVALFERRRRRVEPLAHGPVGRADGAHELVDDVVVLIDHTVPGWCPGGGSPHCITAKAAALQRLAELAVLPFQGLDVVRASRPSPIIRS